MMWLRNNNHPCSNIASFKDQSPNPKNKNVVMWWVHVWEICRIYMKFTKGRNQGKRKSNIELNIYCGISFVNTCR